MIGDLPDPIIRDQPEAGDWQDGDWREKVIIATLMIATVAGFLIGLWWFS